jgi:hypothetical protein
MFRTTETGRVRREPQPQAGRPAPPRPARPKAPAPQRLPLVVDGLTQYPFWGPRNERLPATYTRRPILTLAQMAGAGAGSALDEGTLQAVTDTLENQRTWELEGRDAYRPAEGPARGG